MTTSDKPKHIEVFEGSMRDLADMTRRSYKAMMDHGRLVRVTTEITYRSLAEVRNNLSTQARANNADAVVNVTYLTRDLEEPRYSGSGYLVKSAGTRKP